MAFSTKVIVDTSPDFGDNPQETTESGKPASASLQGLIPNTYHWTKAELYEDGSKVATSEVESFQTLQVGSMTIAYSLYRRPACNEHYVQYTYTSTYAPSSAVLHVTSAGGFTANYQGVIDSANNTITFPCNDWEGGGVVYSCTATLTDIYGESQTSAATNVTSATMNTISCAVVAVTETSVTLSIDKCLDGGFSSGRADWWLETDEPDYEPSRGHVNFLETDTTVTITGLVLGRSYIFNVSATLTDTHIVVSSSYVHATTAHDYSNDYFYLENTYAGDNTFTLTKTGTPATTDLSYSLDKTNWTKFGLNAASEIVTVPQGGKIYLRSSTGLSKNYTDFINFRMSETHTAGGHIASLLDYRQMGYYSTIPVYSLHRLLEGDTNLVDANYIDFTGITSVNSYGCSQMFENCTALTAAPSLCATTLASRCYASMFRGCTSLISAPTLPATTLAEGCYMGMFRECKSLVTSPVLPAAKLATSCYSNMFINCIRLSSVTCLATDISAPQCTGYWLSPVAASGTFTKAASMSGWTTGYNGIPSGWSVQDYREPTP